MSCPYLCCICKIGVRSALPMIGISLLYSLKLLLMSCFLMVFNVFVWVSCCALNIKA